MTVPSRGPLTANESSAELGTAAAQAFPRSLESRADLDWFCSHVLELIFCAFATRDDEFPNPGCKTIAANNTMRLVEGGDEFANFANGLIRNGTSETEHIELLAKLGLIEISKRGSRDAASIAGCARTLLWLESNSLLPILTYATAGMASRELIILAKGVSGLLIDSAARESPSPLSRGEKFVAVTWLGSLDAATRKQLNVRDSLAIVPPIPLSIDRIDASRWAGPPNGSSPILVGKITAVPGGPLATAVGAITGWLLVRHTCTAMVRLFFAYRARAEVQLTQEGLQIREQKSLLGRKFREKSSLISLANVRRLSREIRYARAGTYAGLAALAFGSFIGMRLFVDGLRVPGLSIPLLWLGLATVIGGLLLDFLLANWLDAKEGQCRFVVVTERGRGLCLAGVEPAAVDAVLSALAEKLGGRA